VHDRQCQQGKGLPPISLFLPPLAVPRRNFDGDKTLSGLVTIHISRWLIKRHTARQHKGNFCIFKIKQEILLDCDQFNVLLTHIIFFCILLKAFSFLSACIRDPAFNWDPFNIILIVTAVEVVIGNCLFEVYKILPDFRNWDKKNFQ